MLDFGMININTQWNHILHDVQSDELNSFISRAYDSSVVFPKREELFNAYNLTPLDNIKVVILGQDPYHGVNQANGLAFSVKNGVKIPPSLQNILKELVDDIGCSMPKSGDLTPWAKQGVFLLNSVLSVEEAKPASHQNCGWEELTDKTIEGISQNCENVVFILWGKPAQKKYRLIDTTKHLILTAPHPSPLSSYRGFFGSKPFSKANKFLQEHSIEPVDWCF